MLLVDNSNSFTKFALARGSRLGRIHRIPTPEVTAESFRAACEGLSFHKAVLASVVPQKAKAIRKALADTELIEVSPSVDLGIAVDYPNPSGIGADRLANAAGCAALYSCPAIVVDFGTAVTFDILSATPAYIGGVIAPGLEAMTHYLHSRTALLPQIKLTEPTTAIGRSTVDAMLAGAVFGYRGLIKEILSQIRQEAFPRRKPLIVATGGDAQLIANRVNLFDIIDPHLTLHGLRVVGQKSM